MAGIQGSVHDFSGNIWSGGQICDVCHAPHGTTGGTQAPLWNHEITSTNFTLYTSGTLWENTVQPEPGSISRLCLSCHDGTIAIDSFGGTVPATGTYVGDINPNADLGTDLSNDHPVGILWNHQGDEQRNCTECHDVMSLNMKVKNVKFYPVPNNPGMPNFRLECGTCHDVHDGGPEPKLLRVTIAGSKLCQQCHGK
jgi:predicted CXXCH cytochrome family protein